MRVHEFAKENGLTNADVVKLCAKIGLGVKKPSSGLTLEEEIMLSRKIPRKPAPKKPAKKAEEKPPKKDAATEQKAVAPKKGVQEKEPTEPAVKPPETTAKKAGLKHPETVKPEMAPKITAPPPPPPPPAHPEPAIKKAISAPKTILPPEAPAVKPPALKTEPAKPVQPAVVPPPVSPVKAKSSAPVVPPPIPTTVKPVPPAPQPPVRPVTVQKPPVMPEPVAPPAAPPLPPPVVKVDGTETVGQLAGKLKIPASQLITKLFALKAPATINQRLPRELLDRLASEFHFEITAPAKREKPAPAPVRPQTPAKPEKLVPRAPVVTIMGHVDHGKTTILDALRKSRIALKEFGQITQKIGAYKLNHPRGSVVFLDTPGHEAFTAMRARGASITDIVILVVAADDGVKPQTIEAIDHAKSAGVPIIVAVNKIDKPNADPDKVRRQLSELGLLAEDWGGDTVYVNVSGLTGQGLDQLLEMILLVAEMHEFKANPDKPAEGTVVESQMHKSKGPVLSVLISAGTLRVGDSFVVGRTYGKVRALIDDWGNKITEAGPSTPVEILGCNEVTPPAGTFRVVASEKEAREIIRVAEAEEPKAPPIPVKKLTLEDLYSEVQKGTIKECNLILKTDYHGSIEAIRGVLEKIPSTEVGLSIIHSGTGPIIESDILLAAASTGIVVGFNVTTTPQSQELAKREGVEIKTYHLIYDLADEIRKAMEGMLEPIEKEVLSGQALVKKVYVLSNGGVIAGCLVVEGKVTRDAKTKIIRAGKIVYEGAISNLKRFKDSVKEVVANTECGIETAPFRTIEEGDVIQAIITVRTPRKLT